MMKVIVNTKSNFLNLNGKWLLVKEAKGKRISCEIETKEFGKQTVDFTLKEIEKIKYH